MTRDGLAPGQSWIIPAGPLWQARLDRGGRAHVIGQALARHPEYWAGYADQGSPPRDSALWPYYPLALLRPWHDFARACRAAAFHERMVVAAKRQAAQP